MTLDQLDALAKVLSFTGNKITINDKETDEPRAVKPKQSALRSSILKKVREAAKPVVEKINDLRKEYEADHSKVQEINERILEQKDAHILVELTEDEEAFIKECVNSYAGFTPDMDSFAALYA